MKSEKFSILNKVWNLLWPFLTSSSHLAFAVSEEKKDNILHAQFLVVQICNHYGIKYTGICHDHDVDALDIVTVKSQSTGFLFTSFQKLLNW